MVANVLMLWIILKEMNVCEYLTLQFKFALDKSWSSVIDTLIVAFRNTIEIHILTWRETMQRTRLGPPEFLVRKHAQVATFAGCLIPLQIGRSQATKKCNYSCSTCIYVYTPPHYPMFIGRLFWQLVSICLEMTVFRQQKYIYVIRTCSLHKSTLTNHAV
jgi:hypothetical protein